MKRQVVSCQLSVVRKKHSTRAITHHEELLAQRSCWGVLAVPVFVALSVITHTTTPIAYFNPPAGGGANPQAITTAGFTSHLPTSFTRPAAPAGLAFDPTQVNYGRW